MTVFTRQIATAKRLIGAKGAACLWRVLPDAIQDTNKPWTVAPAAPIEYLNVKIVFLPFTRMNYEFLRQMTGTEIQIGDTYGLMAQQTFKPTITDIVIRNVDGQIFNIYNISPLAPDGTDILYTIHFKA